MTPRRTHISRRDRRRSGFTLLEIMVALAIVATAMVALLGLVNRTIGVHDRLQRVTAATLLAQQVMAETEAGARPEAFGGAGSQGEFAPPHGDYRWRIAYAATPLPSVRMVTVTVTWGDGGKHEQVDLTSFIF
ncbi:MAG: type II secretion system minor pseudopilin GspI [Desulfuromonadales bacterium]|nr:type II secretion system minor pseudopilin GspI [Desulfuromonadales bacterium]